MGAWGSGAFENDDAADWSGTLAEQSDVDVIVEALNAVLEPGAVPEAPEGSEALAAAETVAALMGKPGRNLPDAVAEWVATMAPPKLPLKRKAIRAVGRILEGDSELMQLWAKSADFEAWKAGVEDLLRRLSSDSSRNASKSPKNRNAKSEASTPHEKKRRYRVKPGDVVRIDLGDGEHVYARVCDGSTAVYDLKTSQALPIAEIVSHRVLFNVWVMNYAFTKGIWPVVGNAPLPAELASKPVFFKVDSISKTITKYQNGVEWPATAAECEGLDCAAVWDPEHVVSRLQDHFAGRPNPWVESLRAVLIEAAKVERPLRKRRSKALSSVPSRKKRKPLPED